MHTFDLGETLGTLGTLVGLDKHLQDHPSNENSAKFVEEDSEYASQELGKDSGLTEASQSMGINILVPLTCNKFNTSDNVGFLTRPA